MVGLVSMGRKIVTVYSKEDTQIGTLMMFIDVKDIMI